MTGGFRKLYLFHVRPAKVAKAAMRFTYTWGLGGLAATLVAMSMLTGLMLKFVYIPSPDKAYASVMTLQQTVAFGGFIRNIHYWSANLLVFCVLLHLLRVFFTGAYQGKGAINWIVGLGLLGAALLAGFTGYLLPWDQLAYWAVTICAAMLAYLPGVGGWLQDLFIGGPTLEPQTLSTFFALHTAVLPVVFIVLLPFHFWRIRKAGGLAVRGDERIDVFPHLMVREMTTALTVLAVVMVLAALWDAPLASQANPGLSPNPTKAPWYFSGLQELLLHLPPVLAVAVIPLIVLAALIALPFLPLDIENPGRWFGSPKGGRWAAGAAVAGLVLTPCWIIGQAAGLAFLSWLAPVLALALVTGVLFMPRRRFGVNSRELVQAAFSFLLTLFIVLTATGIWFRGTSMALKWPWT